MNRDPISAFQQLVQEVIYTREGARMGLFACVPICVGACVYVHINEHVRARARACLDVCILRATELTCGVGQPCTNTPGPSLAHWMRSKNRSLLLPL